MGNISSLNPFSGKGNVNNGNYKDDEEIKVEEFFKTTKTDYDLASNINFSVSSITKYVKLSST